MNLSDIEETRRQQLQLLVEKHGQVGIARLLNVTAPYIYQLQTGRRPITENNAEKFERLLSLEPGWLSRTNKSQEHIRPVLQISKDDEVNSLFMLYKQADERGKDTILTLAKHEADRSDPLAGLPEAYDGGTAEQPTETKGPGPKTFSQKKKPTKKK